MRFEWDEAKRHVNLRQHGIDFADVPAIFDADTVTLIDDRFDYGETRYITLGLLKGRTIFLLHRLRRRHTHHLGEKGHPV